MLSPMGKLLVPALVWLVAFSLYRADAQAVPQPVLGHRSAPVLHVDGLDFKDLDGNGKLDLYEDWRRSPAERTADLLSRMSVEQLAGTMLHGTLPVANGPLASIGMGSGGYDFGKVQDLIGTRHITTFITRYNALPAALAEGSNQLQAMAEAAPLGIPLLLSTDPRSQFQYTAGASVQPGQFSKWPESTGLAAIRDPAVTRRFADIVRQEYEAVGIRESLAPQADLSTEPRWPRINGTFGEDAQLTRSLVAAYIDGLQAGGHGKAGLNPRSVVAVVKHWVGYGAQQDGFDSHNYYGRFSGITDANLPNHITPFLGAFEAHVGTVMPTYSILENVTVAGKPIEQVGAGMNKQLITGLLRGTYHFEGVVLSDWAITNDCDALCRSGVPAGQHMGPEQIGTPWGVENLSKEDRFAKAVNAGVDQIGGSNEPQYILAAVKDGKLTADRLREAAGRILLQKFELGLFENPYVDASRADSIVGSPAFVQAGREAQEHATVLLKNDRHVLPLRAGAKVFLSGVDAAAASAHGLQVVGSPELADVAIVRAGAPFELLHPGYFFGAIQHEGRLNFRPGDPAYDTLVRCGKTPAVLTVSLDRPAILTEVEDRTAALLGNFGIGDDALLDVLLGKAQPEGKLPFELPSSMQAVEAQQSDVPHDSAHPLYPFGFGLSY